ncbi:hypothetical protein FOA43_004382 [Brettanomyces nanus]|uniref:Uncharacterized protein n=1 Tax=Eeniella nana TaxID=13502 RepID=A0A875S7R3_EENNA|nr:uncharacterized protein FOA43_004382 [Brettanomyces nanus]QPG76988.1 hypothetical protein FOA43_004382 [Brettanomyces nanus]
MFLRQLSKKTYIRWNSTKSTGDLGKYSSLRIPSSNPSPFSLRRIEEATRKANELLERNATEEKLVKDKQTSSVHDIRAAQSKFDEVALSDKELRDLPEILAMKKQVEQLKKGERQHQRTPQGHLKQTKSEKTISAYGQKVLNQLQKPAVTNNRYIYDPKLDLVVDKLRAPTQILGMRHKKNSDKETVGKVITGFPVCLVLKTIPSSGTSLRIKEMVDYIEGLNRNYNDGKSGTEINLLDPNDYELVLDYTILSGSNMLKQFLTEDDTSEVDMSFLWHMQGKQEVMLILITETGFRNSSSFLHQFEDRFSKYFELTACILNAPKFPVLSLIRKPDSDLTNRENEIMEDNLYVVASLGLVKVSKKKDGTLILTKRK